MNVWSKDIADWMILFIHVPLGGIALIAGAAALMVKKDRMPISGWGVSFAFPCSARQLPLQS